MLLKWKHKLGLRCQEKASEGCFFQKFSGGESPTAPLPRVAAAGYQKFWPNKSPVSGTGIIIVVSSPGITITITSSLEAHA
jgi:hypothetical protein